MITEAATLTLDYAPAPAGIRMPIEATEFRRVDLARAFKAYGFKVGAEVGVESGEFSEIICRENPGVEHYAVDAWRVYPGYREHVSQEKLDGFKAATLERLRPFHCPIVTEWSVDAARRFADRTLDYVYLDANHAYEHVVADLAAWVPKVRSGGVVAGHDYRHSKGKAGAVFGVVEAVTGWTRAYNVSPWFVLRGDHSPSWYWVKP